MAHVNIHLYYGGRFVTNVKRKKTTYKLGPRNFYGISLHSRVEEVCYFEFVDWIRNGLKLKDVRKIWFRRK